MNERRRCRGCVASRNSPGPGGDIALSIVTRSSPAGIPARAQLMGVTITSRGSGAGRDAVETFRLRRPAPDSPAVLVQADAIDACRLPRHRRRPRETRLRARAGVAATLESSCVDVPFQKALPIAFWLLESRGIPRS